MTDKQTRTLPVCTSGARLNVHEKSLTLVDHTLQVLIERLLAEVPTLPDSFAHRKVSHGH